MSTFDRERFVEDHWDDVVAQLPPNLDQLAAKHGVLKYRRAIPDVPALLRLGFAYSVLDYSLRTVAAWGGSSRVCKRLSDVALLNQLQRLRPLAAELLQLMLDPLQDLALLPPGLMLVDATSFGITGTDWRLNLAYSGATGLSVAIGLTRGSVGESIDVRRLRAGDVVLGDRYYAKSKLLFEVSAAGADVLVRATRSIALKRPDGRQSRPDDFTRTASMRAGEVAEHPVQVANHKGQMMPMRLIIVKKTDAATERTLVKLQRLKTKKGRVNTDSPEAQQAAQYMYLLTTVSEDRATAPQIAIAYRYRWQVEIAFKRWKSLLHLDRVRAHGELAETYILCKLLAAVLVEAALNEAAISPWGARFARAAPQANRAPRVKSARKARSRSPSATVST
jgi:hypothetical protein